MSRRSFFFTLILFLALPLAADVHFIKWNHANGSGDEKNVAAVDLDTGKVLWEKKLKKEVNFVLAVDTGVLVGCDDGALYLLRPENGTPVWIAKLGLEVNEFHRDAGDAWLVSHDKQVYWLVGRDGKVKATWK